MIDLKLYLKLAILGILLVGASFLVTGWIQGYYR